MSSGDGWKGAGEVGPTGLLGDLFALGEEPDEPARVLIVDDEPYVLRAIQRLLRNTGAEIFTAPYGIQAIKLLVGREIAVLISDQFMPGMSGAELLEHARQVSPDTVRVMLTGQADGAALVRVKEEELAHMTLFKPWQEQDHRSAFDLAFSEDA